MLRSLLFSFGLLLELGAFVLGHSDRIPSVMATVSPDSTKLEAALAKLVNGEDLVDYDEGFSEASQLLRDRFESSFKLFPRDAIERIGPGVDGPPTNFPGGQIKLDPNFQAATTSGTLIFSASLLRDEVQRLERVQVLWWSSLLFASGIGLQIIGFVLEVTSRRAPKHKRTTEHAL
jgi:hypothetical protein